MKVFKTFRSKHHNPGKKGIIHSIRVTETLVRKMNMFAKTQGVNRNAMVNAAIKYFLDSAETKQVRRELNRAEYEWSYGFRSEPYIASIYIELRSL